MNSNGFVECTAAKVDAYHQVVVDGGDPVNTDDLWFLYKVDVSDCDPANTFRFFFDSDVLKRFGGGMCGEPHVKTWSGKYFDYMGECDLVLLHAPDFDGKGIDLDVHVRTTIRYWYSFIEVAAVQIGDEILEVGAYGNHALNYVDDALADARNHRTIGGYPVYHTQPSLKKHVYDIVLGPGQNITITSFKDLVGVHTTSHHFPSGVSGIMGSINGTMLGRDGVTDMSADTDAFGQEWQVRDAEPNLFRAIRDPQYPTKCNLPSAAVQEHRRLAESSVDEEDAKKACAKYSSGKEFDNCVYDIMAMGDLEYAEAGSF